MNESQKIYHSVIAVYAEISGKKAYNMRPSTGISKWDRKKLADKLSNLYCVPINDFENLKTIAAFAEHIKRYDMVVRLPEIEKEVRDILKTFFANRVYEKDELVFNGIPDPLYENCYSFFKEEMSKRFGINGYDIYRAEIFKKDFSVREIVDWIYLHEKQDTC